MKCAFAAICERALGLANDKKHSAAGLGHTDYGNGSSSGQTDYILISDKNLLYYTYIIYYK